MDMKGNDGFLYKLVMKLGLAVTKTDATVVLVMLALTFAVLTLDAWVFNYRFHQPIPNNSSSSVPQIIYQTAPSQ